MKLFGMCIDKRVVVGVVAAAGLLWWLAPGAFAAALPLLIFAICPLSMLLMMKAMGQMGGQQTPDASQPPAPGVQPAAAPQAGAGNAAPADPIAAAAAAAADVNARRN
ncbi:MAG: DUF2933 domain-containing protein [Actinobacteria bacterium]|nr:DUF2933 domain-containing protein [Actinomycetota bacterium]